MTKTAEQARDLLLKLSPLERSLVIDSVSNGVEEEFDAMISRRVEEIKSGKVEGIPHDEVMRRLRAKLAHARAE